MPNPPFKILVGIDFSSSSERALDYAIELAGRLGGEIDLMHVFPFMTIGDLAELTLSGDDISKFSLAKEQLAALRLNRIPAAIPSRAHLRIGHPVGGLVDAIALFSPNLVAVGSHGRSSVMSVLLGSVSERMARRSTVPVIVVPAEGRHEAPAEITSVAGAEAL